MLENAFIRFHQILFRLFWWFSILLKYLIQCLDTNLFENEVIALATGKFVYAPLLMCFTMASILKRIPHKIWIRKVVSHSQKVKEQQCNDGIWPYVEYEYQGQQLLLMM